jgi:3-deoxy-D-manno-octulosonic-acid transferase
MKILYSLSVLSYSALIYLVSFLNTKARLRSSGIKNTFKLIHTIPKSQQIIWFHCASLGEFEQARNLIDKIKQNKSEYKIALSFFSPSGYEIRKNYPNADYVFYLPTDTKRNAKKLIRLLNPKIVIFVKYEFWHYYLTEIRKNNIPSFLISGIFRKNQVFFKFYGSFFQNILKTFEHLFVQNIQSEKLLESIGIKSVTVTGDTRFDRVSELSEIKKEFELIKRFANNHSILVAGSTWKSDEEILIRYFNETDNSNLKLIIAPHEISNETIHRIINLSEKNIIKYSEADEKNVHEKQILLIDNIGMLASLYAYADYAYIGGGFSKGIHNTLEAAVNKIPVIFGPKYQKFEEAKQLINRNIAFSISDYKEFHEILSKLVLKTYVFDKNASDNFFKENIGATNKIFEALHPYL